MYQRSAPPRAGARSSTSVPSLSASDPRLRSQGELRGLRPHRAHHVKRILRDLRRSLSLHDVHEPLPRPDRGLRVGDGLIRSPPHVVGPGSDRHFQRVSVESRRVPALNGTPGAPRSLTAHRSRATSPGLLGPPARKQSGCAWIYGAARRNEADRILGEYWTEMPWRSLAEGRTEPRSRGPRHGRARNPVDGAGDMVCRAGHDLGARGIEMEDDHGPVVGEHMGARADRVDLATRANFSRQVDPLTRCMPLAAWRHTSRDVESTTEVSVPNGFLTRGPVRSQAMVDVVWSRRGRCRGTGPTSPPDGRVRRSLQVG